LLRSITTFSKVRPCNLWVVIVHVKESKSCNWKQIPDLPFHMSHIGTIDITRILSKFVRVRSWYWSKKTKITIGNDICLDFSLYNISIIVPIALFTKSVAT